MAVEWKKYQYNDPRITSTASSATPTPNVDTTDLYLVTALAEAATFGAPAGTPSDGQKLLIRIKDNGTARSLSWNAIYVGDSLPDTTVASVTLYLLCIYDSAASKWDATLKVDGALGNIVEDTTPQLGGFLDPNSKYIGMAKGGDIASASPLVIDTDGDYFDVTGTTGFAAMTVAANRHFFLQFDGALVMTHHVTNLDLPGGANITTAAGDVGEFFSTGANTVQCVNYTKADGTAINGVTAAANLTDNALVVGDGGAKGAKSLALGAANLKLFMNAAGTANEYASGSYIGTIWRDIAAVDGNVACTGVGFKPSVLIMIAATATDARVSASWGVSVGTTSYMICTNRKGNTDTFVSPNAGIVWIYINAGIVSKAAIASLDADGFTLVWAKTGSPTGTVLISFIAIR